jgi:hypothetical protein
MAVFLNMMVSFNAAAVTSCDAGRPTNAHRFLGFPREMSQHDMPQGDLPRAKPKGP